MYRHGSGIARAISKKISENGKRAEIRADLANCGAAIIQLQKENIGLRQAYGKFRARFIGSHKLKFTAMATHQLF